DGGEADADGDAVDGGDGGLAVRHVPGVEGRVVGDLLPGHLGAGEGALEAADVCASAVGAAVAGGDHGADVRVGVELVVRLDPLGVHGLVHGVEDVRAVVPDDADAADAFDLDGVVLGVVVALGLQVGV